MIEQVADALKRKEYKTAARLLKPLLKKEPNNPWVRLYLGRLYEETGKLEAAEDNYRQLLKNTTNPKIMSQARQGLGRLEAREQKRREQALAQATAAPGSEELGVFVLEAVASELKQAAAVKFAQIMQLDPYSARLQLPSRGWRLYRTGAIGELKFYASSLRQAEIPCFCLALADIRKINVFSLNYFSEITYKGATVVCHNFQEQLGSLNFNWSEVSQRVEGRLPLFEEVMDMDVRRKLQRKRKILDYAEFCDLHLSSRNSIIRLCDHHYQFQKGIALASLQSNSQSKGLQEHSLNQGTTRSKWNSLLDFLNRQLPQLPVWSDFTIFANTAIDYPDLLGHLPSHINLSRWEETSWDPAFELYSGLVFLKNGSEY
ncbi:MAG: tetratricopeptide repeat protein [Symploca sp. SIO2C1]|nr:tetratricopeptide repeat protein [Symploca sp. SIO2C1]